MMSKKERERKVFLSRKVEGHLKLKELAVQMGLSYRQAQRVWKRYCEEGDKGLVHRNRGRVGDRGYGKVLWEAVLKRYQERYEGFGPTLVNGIQIG